MAYIRLSRMRQAGLLLVLSLAGCAGGGGSDDGGSSLKFAGVEWTAPSERVDGSSLSPAEIAGYRVYYGDEKGVYPNKIDIDNSIADDVDLSEISAGKYFVVVTTIDTDGRESEYSLEVEVTL